MNFPLVFLSGSKDNPATNYTSPGLKSGGAGRGASYMGKGKGRGKGKSNRNSYTLATKKGECHRYGTTVVTRQPPRTARRYSIARSKLCLRSVALELLT